MNITLIDGNANYDTHYEDILSGFKSGLEASGNQVSMFTVRDLQIKYCTGCWGCWVKTPGLCVFADDTNEICESAINSDFLMFISPLIMAYPSYLIKKVQDKLIPLLHPYIKLVNNECHHYSRYDNYPHIGFIYQPEKDTDDTDLKILKDIFERFALNFKSELSVFKNMNEIKSVIDEIAAN